MKFILTIVFVISITTASGQGQSPVQLANKIADRMKDTLGLTIPQRHHIFTMTLQVQVQKKNNPGHFYHQDTATQRHKDIEKMRDILYRRVLTVAQFDVYRIKKYNIIFKP